MAPVEGYWGKQTATIDWCEENYVVSYYVAEFWNTVSNAVMILAPLAMMVRALKENHEKRFLYSFTAVTVVGIGSWLFHMTLRYSMQLMDELPMIWGSSFLVYSIYMMRSKADEENRLLQVVLVVYCIVVTLVYVLINLPIFHESKADEENRLLQVKLVAYCIVVTLVAYAIMVIGMVILATKVVITMPCNRILYCVSTAIYALGFLFWNVDNIYCNHLKSLRAHPMGKSSGMLFQCHAWWHIFAGVGTYLALLFTIETRYIYLQKKPHLKFFLSFWPYVTIAGEEDKLK